MFSVVIPAYNCESTIKQVLKSVIDQTAFNLIEEIVIVNDGSTDGTEIAIREFIEANNLSIIVKYFYHENHGVSYTRNKGIRSAKAEWIALLDSDDIWLKNKIERQAQIIKENPNISFLGAEYPVKFLFRTHSGLVKVTPKQLCIRSMPTTPSVVFKKSVAEKVGLYDETMKYCEDINFFQHFFLADSYYVLAEQLVQIGVEKNFYAQSGLSSHILEMHKGRNKNVRDLYEMKLIGKAYMREMLIFNQLKYFRRVVLRKISQIKNR